MVDDGGPLYKPVDEQPITLQHAKEISQDQYEAMNSADRLDLVTDAIKEVNEAEDLIEGSWEPDGPCIITIHVAQQMKRREG